MIQTPHAAEFRRPNRNERVWAIVARIPDGRVATYGQIALLAGLSGPTGARQVGYALAALPADTALPWHRVINAAGQVSPRADPDAARIQRSLLESEGIDIGSGGAVVLERYRWQPGSGGSRSAPIQRQMPAPVPYGRTRSCKRRRDEPPARGRPG